MKVSNQDYPGFHDRMFRLREMDIGLDGAISAAGGEVRVHLPFLAACNQTLFNRITGLVKQGRTELNARNTSLKGVQIMIDYCYTGELDITEDNFEHTIDAALSLEFLDIVQQCVQFALTSKVNANIWCHFLRAAFKHPRFVQPNNFVTDLILHNITKIPKEDIIKGLNAAYIEELLEYGTFDDSQRIYSLNIFLEIIMADTANIKTFEGTIIHMRDKVERRDNVTIPPDVPMTKLMAFLDMSLDIGFTAAVGACAAALEKSPLTAEMTSQVLQWTKQHEGSESVTHLNKICYHAFCDLPLDVSEDNLCSMLDSNYLGPSSELDILKAAISWIEHNNVNIAVKRRVVRLIRFGRMSKEEMEEVFMHHYVPGCETELASAMRYHLCPYTQPLATCNIRKMRLSQPEIYVMGGSDVVNNHNRHVIKSRITQEGGNMTLSAFKDVCESPFALCASACAELNGFIFVSGGQGDSGTVGNLYRFDCRSNKWLELKEMGQKRSGHTLTSIERRLVAIGGWDHEYPFDCVESYDILNNTWTIIDPLPVGRVQHSAIHIDGVLYISGGSQAKTLFTFCDNVWSEKSPMLYVRQCHAMTGFSGMLLVAGGTINEDGKWRSLMSTECYDVAKDQWTELSPPRFECQQVFSTRICNWFYVIGGFSDNDETIMDRIQRYNIETNEWEVCEIKLPYQMSELTGACIANH